MGKQPAESAAEKIDWIEALEAVHLIAQQVGGDKQAKKAITQRLIDGAIASRGWWFAQAVDDGGDLAVLLLNHTKKISTATSPLSAHELLEHRIEASKPIVSETTTGTRFARSVRGNHVPLFPAFWSLVTKSAAKRWRWDIGLFLVERPGLRDVVPVGKALVPDFPRMIWYSLGVEFSKADILKIVSAESPAPGPAAQPDSMPARRRGRKRGDFWPDWIAEVVLLHHEEGIGTLGPSQLIDKIADRLMRKDKHEPAYNSVYETAERILHVLSVEGTHRRS